MLTRAKERGESRIERVPVSGKRDVMTVADKDDAYVYYWVNDVDNHIDKFQKGGYELVQDDVKVGDTSIDNPKGIDSTVSKGVGGGITAYLMRIKREWYEEDRQTAAKKTNDTEADMKRTLNSGQDGTYGNVTIS